jgi:hypothetical protein
METRVFTNMAADKFIIDEFIKPGDERMTIESF